MRRGIIVYALAVSLLLLTIPVDSAASVPTVASLAQPGSVGGPYQSTSWGLGVVVPEGAQLQDKGVVRWEGVTNVTVALTLPNITMPDGIVYAVLSLMTGNGGVLQAAAGIYPGQEVWLSYSWSISSVETVPLTYHWVLNGSGPQMAPGAPVSMSIFRANGTWNLRVFDEDTRSSAATSFPSDAASSLRSGDQQVFALESYSRTASTFQNMGNLTLQSVLINGERVVGGVYTYGGWDPSHNPVFVVGSSGASPPVFISINRENDESFSWGYAAVWNNGGNPFVAMAPTVLALSAGVCAVVGAVLWLTRNPKPRDRLG